MKKLVKGSINYSEGRRLEVVEAIDNSVRQIDGVILAASETWDNFNRSVITFIGPPQLVKQAALAVSEAAIKHIDMTQHQGDHPRIGAVDVVTFNPLQNVTVEECVQLSREFGQEFVEQFNVPIYLYDKSATQPDRQNLWNLRVGDYEGLANRIVQPAHKPDYGPAEFVPRSGATIAGAGKVLVVQYINLGTTDLDIALKIAQAVHKDHGGLANVKARAIRLEDRGLTQIPISNEDYEQTPLYKQFELVKAEAARYGVPIVSTELGHMIPVDVLLNAAAYYLQLEGFQKDRIIEMFLQKEYMQ